MGPTPTKNFKHEHSWRAHTRTTNWDPFGNFWSRSLPLLLLPQWSANLPGWCRNQCQIARPQSLLRYQPNLSLTLLRPKLGQGLHHKAARENGQCVMPLCHTVLLGYLRQDRGMSRRSFFLGEHGRGGRRTTMLPLVRCHVAMAHQEMQGLQHLPFWSPVKSSQVTHTHNVRIAVLLEMA